jgi:RimJ/RimL family protein N-acetyltransferase
MIRMNKIVLRSPTEEDIDFVVSMRTSLSLELAAQCSPVLPRTRAEFAERMRATDGASISSGGAADVEFIISPVSEESRPIGIGGLYNIDLHNGSSEFGVTIGDESFRGKGLGFDSHTALLYYGFALRRLHRIYGLVKADNIGVLGLCNRLGMTQEGVLREHRWKDGSYVDTIVLGILANEWGPGLACRR